MKKALFILTILILPGYTIVAQVNLNLGLKAYYPFSGNANDVSGNNNNPVFNNATLTADRFSNPNSAYHFDGATSYMQVPNSTSLNTNNKLSLSAWVRPTGFYAGSCHGNAVITKGNSGNTPGLYAMWYDDNAGTNGGNCSGPLNPAVENFYGVGCLTPPPGYTPYIQTNQWYSVIITYDGTTARLYVNCVLKNSVSQGGLTFNNTDDLFIGKTFSGAFPYWVNGDIDEVRIYDRALNVDEVNTLGGCITPVACNNWLSTPSDPSYVTAGDIDVTGNQLTVEATYNRTFPLNSGLFPGHLVSKHSNAADLNYALFPNGCSITTNVSGYKETFENCALQLNKTYHVAMVYDGSNLKFYRNGFLHSQVPCTGNLINNDLQTTFALIANGGAPSTQFKGYVNEVRIWNVARTQAQLQTYMNSSLPNPTTISGLLGYYTFDNLLNKQGNVAYNASLNGGASINTTNPNCTFLADSCSVIPPIGISNIINTYTPVLALNPCDNKLTVEDVSTFNTGDTVLMIQMKGAIIDSTNTANFGTITSYKNAGNYEFNYVKSKAGNIIELKNKLTRQYDIPFGKVQLVRVPYFPSNVIISDTLTCLPWDGNKGGILVLNVQDTINLSADINVSGRGFKGSQPITTIPGTGIFNQTDYAYPANAVHGTRKGEGITNVSENLIFCRGPLGSGGGGGNSSNAGGGGGGNGGSGGRGGNEWGGSAIVLSNGGVGGNNCIYSGSSNKVFMGGAGGAGHANDGTGTPGGNGGGIVIIKSGTIKPNAYKILSNGFQGPDCVNISVCADGVGGGGAGGTILINAQTITSNFPVQTNGGKGADNNISGPNAHGPGGGGGGGSLLVNTGSLLTNITYSSNGGAAGKAINHANTNWGALNGSNGISTSNFIIPFTTTPFQKNIDSVRIKDSVTICKTYDFKGLAYTNTNPVSSWQWSFGDGFNAGTQNTTHTYINSGTYTVKLVVTDINGCKDSLSKNITITPFTANAGNDTTICTTNTVSTKLNASAGASYAWTPAVFLNNPAIQSPTATISSTTLFTVTISDVQGCIASDTVKITIAAPPPAIRYPTLTGFSNLSLQLQARNLGGNSYVWQPSTGLNNNFIINPVFRFTQSQEYKIKIATAAGCNVTDTLLITIKGKKGIYVPRAFSPNSNGTNDRLYPILVGISKLNYFRVFNRWGNLVFETNSDNPAAGWDGRIKGNPQPPETYTWTVEGIDIDGIVIKNSGNTFLIR